VKKSSIYKGLWNLKARFSQWKSEVFTVEKRGFHSEKRGFHSEKRGFHSEKRGYLQLSFIML